MLRTRGGQSRPGRNYPTQRVCSIPDVIVSFYCEMEDPIWKTDSRGTVDTKVEASILHCSNYVFRLSLVSRGAIIKLYRKMPIQVPINELNFKQFVEGILTLSQTGSDSKSIQIVPMSIEFALNVAAISDNWVAYDLQSFPDPLHGNQYISMSVYPAARAFLYEATKFGSTSPPILQASS